MAAISSPGIGSGLDVDGLVQQLVQAEASGPTRRFDRQEQRYEQELSALGQFKSALEDFQGAGRGLEDFSNFSSRAARSSDSEVVGVSADRTASPGSYEVSIEQLAGSHKLASPADAFPSPDDPVGLGTLTFQFGSYGEDGQFEINGDRSAGTVDITPENNSIRGIRDAINEAGVGVRASVVNDGEGARLVLTSTETGAKNSMRIVVDDAQGTGGGLSRLAHDPTTPEGPRLAEIAPGRDAVATIDGIATRSASNSLTDAIDGLSFDLQAEGSAQVDVDLDRDKARNALGGFIEGYNQFMQTANKLTAWDADAEEGGPLNGDSTVRMVVSRLQQTISAPVEGVDGPYRTLADLGVRTNKDGTLSVDEARMNSAIEDDMEAVGHLIARSGQAVDPLVEFTGDSRNTEPGSYMVDVDAPASQGRLEGNRLVGGPITIGDGNDTFAISVNSITSGTIQLRHGEYASLAEVAAEMQSRINGDDNLRRFDAAVNVEVTDDNRLAIVSRDWGSSSTIGIREAADNMNRTLGLAVADGIPGEDIQGRINGLEARGSGRHLIGQTGPAEGLELLIEGDEVGQRDMVHYSRGLGEVINGHVNNFMDTEGSLNVRERTLNSRMDEVADRREQLQERLERLERRYRSEFSRLDGMLGEMEQTSQFLEQRLAALPGSGGSK